VVTTTRYIYDTNSQLIGEFILNSNGTPNEMNETTTEYEYLGNMPLVALKRSMTSDPINWIEVDHLNSPKSVVKLGKTKDGYSYNNVVWRWETEPYGSYPAQETMKFDYGYGRDGIATTTTFTMNLRFPGQIFDKETGTHYNVFRDYDPQTGRYLQADPIGLGGGMNRWGYVGGNPMNGVDPLGLKGVGVPVIPQIAIPVAACRYLAGYLLKSGIFKSRDYVIERRDGVKMRSDCNQNDYDDYVQQIDNKCKSKEVKRSCNPNDSFADIYNTIDTIKDCNKAREDRENNCFRGGDTGHNQAMINNAKAISNCRDLLFNKVW
jgi:RHS repeat-associated protein